MKFSNIRSEKELTHSAIPCSSDLEKAASADISRILLDPVVC